jgi:hypothetical protein
MSNWLCVLHPIYPLIEHINWTLSSFTHNDMWSGGLRCAFTHNDMVLHPARCIHKECGETHRRGPICHQVWLVVDLLNLAKRYLWIFYWDLSLKAWTSNTLKMKTDAKVCKKYEGLEVLKRKNATGNKCIHHPLGNPRGSIYRAIRGAYESQLSTRSYCHYSHLWFIIIFI